MLSFSIISSDPMEHLLEKAQSAGASFTVCIWPMYMMSGKTLRENSSLVKRRLPRTFLCSSETFFFFLNNHLSVLLITEVSQAKSENGIDYKLILETNHVPFFGEQ